MNKFRSVLVLSTTLALASACLVAEARVGSSSRSTSSSSRSSSTSAPSRPSVAPSAPSRVGGGTSGGMQRSGAMSQASALKQAPPPSGGGYSNTAPARPPVSNYAQTQPSPAAPQAAPRNFSTGQMVGGAAAGALGGYLLGRATAPTPAPVQTGVANNGVSGSYVDPSSGVTSGVGPQGPGALVPPGGMSSAMTAGNQQSSGSGFGTFLAVVAGLGLLGALAYMFMKNKNATPSLGGFKTAPAAFKFDKPAAAFMPAVAAFTGDKTSVEQDLLKQAPQLFRDLQSANNRADKVALARMVDTGYLPVLLDGIDDRIEPSNTKVLSLEVKGGRVLDFTEEDDRFVGSIFFAATVDEGDGHPVAVEEVWHFVRPLNGSEWKIAGIEQA